MKSTQTDNNHTSKEQSLGATARRSGASSRHTKGRSVIPGRGLTMGVTITMLSLLILIPLASILTYSFRLSFSEFIELITRQNVVRAFRTSISCALIAALINSVFGLILAWVLVRYDFPGKRLMDAMIELPFALPTAVAGITLSKMYSDKGLIGQFFAKYGISISYTKIGLTIALVFIGIPFVVRALQPVIEKLSPSWEEAAATLGASPAYTFRRVILPELTPALLTGFGLALARGIGEYGSVIYISGNSEKNGTQVVSYVIMQKLNSGSADYEGAAAIALVLLIISFLLLFFINMVQLAAGRRAS
ncbi:MAG: sulfate ABC transporter permease subunit CysT [Lachnospiraceae bacterium]|nr:sulfate ABC transporter permease subunit CysT [Lachnospiraceae bacterium]